MVEMRARNRSALDRLRIEDRQMARVALLIENVRHHEAYALRHIRCARHKYRFGDRKARAIGIGLHFARVMVEAGDPAMEDIIRARTAHAREVAIAILSTDVALV